MWRYLLLIPLALVLITDAEARIHRSHAAIDAFKREHPCPSTGKPRGRCQGWIIDHRIALCVGGEDAPENMEWQTVAQAKAKDKWECKPGWEMRLNAATGVARK